MKTRAPKTEEPAPKRPRGRPAGGSDEVVRAVLAAALEQLGECGYQRLSIDDVARAAGVNKTSVYRRWPTKSELVVAALQSNPDEEAPFKPSGDLKADLTTLLTRKAHRLSTPRGRAIALALMNIDGDERMVKLLRVQAFALSSSVIQAAVARGELAPDVDPEVVSETLLAPVILRVLIYQEGATATFIENVVERTLEALWRRGKKQH